MASVLLALGPGIAARSAAEPTKSSTVVWVVPGRGPSFPWPVVGQAAVAVTGIGLVGGSPYEVRVPIASLTKMMTALVVLRDHPLQPDTAGALIPFGARDVAEWRRESRAGDSVVEVGAGESLTEYQALEALLIPSADNVADRLAVWDAGTTARFVAKMNAQARVLDLASTHYSDPSGLAPGSSSTAIDQTHVAAELMQNPVVRSIVRRPRINLPVVGVLPNRNPALSVDGIVGVKGGFTSHAHSCLVTAAFRLGHNALIISVTLGQSDPLTAAHIDEALLQRTTHSLHEHFLFPAPTGTGLLGFGLRIRPPGAERRRALTTVVWPGLVVRETISPSKSPRHPDVHLAHITVSTPWSTDGPFLVQLPVPLLPRRLHRPQVR